MAQPKYWGTDKGLVIELITKNIAEFWRELQGETRFDEEYLNSLLRELFESNELYKNEYGAYRVPYELYQSYLNFQLNSGKTREKRGERSLVEKIERWIEANEIDVKLDNEHFFLDGRYLDQFTKFILNRAKRSIVVVNPYVDEIDVSKILGDKRKGGIRVQLLTRRPGVDDVGKKIFHEKLVKDGVDLCHQHIHAKLIIVDDEAAVVSSMNFYSGSFAGQTWEAGIITVNKNVINSIKTAISNKWNA